MMTENKYRMLIWLVVILFTMNLTTIGSLIYHARKTNSAPSAGTEYKAAEEGNLNGSALAAEQGARYFREKLGLTPEQMNAFREDNREYNRKTNWIARDLDVLRVDLVSEMTGPEPDTLRLNGISQAIGEKHEELKNLTVDYYLSMREVCNEDQKEKLNAIFTEMVRKTEDEPVQRGRRMGRGWNR